MAKKRQRKYKPVPKHKSTISINSLRNLKQYQKMLIKPEMMLTDLAEALFREGRFIITAAYHNRGFNNRTWNLHDSYVSVVFLNGEVYKEPAYVGEPKSKRVDRKTRTSGRDEAQDFIDLMLDRVPDTGVQLVIAAAMYYSGMVESRGYDVLAQVDAQLEDLLSKGLNISKYLSHISIDAITEASIYREHLGDDVFADMTIVD